MFWGVSTDLRSLLRDHRHEDFKDLKCMNFTSKGTREILVAGCQDKMFKVDVDKGTVTDTVGMHSRTGGFER
jgi:hypothetical protein